MINSMRLVNWRSHSDTSLEFRKGTNLLVGMMGAGKSSVLEGISFALFGTFPAIERRKMKLENIVRLNEAKARITIEFEWEGSVYSVIREIERSKRGVSSFAELTKDGALVESGPVAVSTYVRNLTGVDYDLFTRAIYSEQNNIDYFLNLDPRRRKEEIDSLLGLDKFEIARSNIISVINRTRSKREDAESRFSNQKLEEASSKENELAKMVTELHHKMSQTISLIEQKKQDIEVITSRFTQMKKSKDLFENLEKDSLRLSSQIDLIRKELDGKSADQAAVEENEKKVTALSERRSKLSVSSRASDQLYSSLSKDSGSIEARMKAAEESSKAMETAEAELKAILGTSTPDNLQRLQQEGEQLLLSMDAERKSLEREVAEINDSMSRLKPGLSECPLCLTKLTDSGIAHVKEEKDALISIRKGRISDLLRDISLKRKDSDAMKERIRRVGSLIERSVQLRKMSDGAGTLQSEKKRLEESLAKAAEEKRLVQTELEGVSSQLEAARLALSQVKSIYEKIKELNKAESQLADTRSKLSSITFDVKGYEELRSSLENSRLDFERAIAGKASAESQLKMGNDMLRLVREELSSLRTLEKEVQSFFQLEEQLSIYKNALLETQTGLRMSLIDAINSAMNEVWTIFYPYHNYRALRLGVSEKDYLFEVDDGTGWKTLESMASGGERACAALALRMALAMVLTPKLSWLILDEPTHNLDSDAVEMLSSALQFKVPEVVKQTFVITHDEAFMGSDFASSYRLRRDKEHNGETRIDAT